MYAVSFYAVAPGQFDRVSEVYPRHRAYLDEFARGGQIVMIGTGLVGESRILDWDPLEFPIT